MSQFLEGYSRVVENAGGISGTFESAAYVAKVETAINNAIEALKQEADHRQNVDVPYLKGWLAEQWHAETLKVSGVARGRSDIWAEVQGSNVTGDDIRYGDSTSTNVAEVKYYKTGEDTAKAISRPEYEGNAKIIPADQKDSVRAEAERLSLRNREIRPEQAAQYEDTAKAADDRLRVDNAESTPLDEKTAKGMAQDLKNDGELDPDKYGLNTESFVEWSDVARQSGEAALHAAAFSAALIAAPYIWKTICEYIESGQLDVNVIAARGRSVFLGASSSGLRGGVAAGLTAACKAGLMGGSLKSISPAAIGMATTMSLNAIGYAAQLQQGKITGREFAHHCLRDSFSLSCGMSGAAIGQLLIPVPLFGALAGNLVGSTLGAVAFEGVNHVVLGICVESGWTLLGSVNQDYVVSGDVLQLAGYDLFSTQSFQTQSFSTSSFNVRSFSNNSLSFTPIRRGVISCNTIGFLQ
jgi:hypothetical protein